MAVSDVFTYNLLNRWPVIMLESPWQFNQITGAGDYAPLSHPCDEVYIQSERDEIANALDQAVQQASEYLGYDPRPVWRTDTVDLGSALPYSGQIVRLPRGYVSAFGSRATSLIQAGAAIVYSDADGDGVDDTGTITVATSLTDPAEIQVFFQVADGAPEAADARWQIEPAAVTIAAGAATIVIKRWLLVHPTTVWAKPYDSPNYVTKHVGDTQTPGDFVTHVDVYRVYNDAAGAISIKVPPYTGCDDWEYTSYDGNAFSVNGTLGLVRVRAANAACLRYYPSRVEISYKAGYPLVNGLMDRELETMLIRLANTKMPQQPGNFCDRTLDMWQRDLEPVPAERLNARSVNNPIGIREGEINAWRIIERRALGKGGRAF